MATATKTRRHKAPTAAQREKWAKDRADKAEQLQAALAVQVQDMASGEQWQAYLDFVGSFHNYSFRNALLIQVQRPTATAVAGYVAWQEKGRQVRKGEQAISILGFATKKVTNPATGEEEKKAYFPVRKVFAEDQTEPITEDMIEDIRKRNPKAKLFSEVPADPVQRLAGEDDNAIADRVRVYLESLGWTVEREELVGPNGYTTTDGSKRVVISSTLSPAQAAKTSLHELAHVLLHTEDGKGIEGLGQATKELEAESASYVSANILGLDSTGYSIGYLTSWSEGDPEAVKATADRVLKGAHLIVEALDPVETEEEVVAN